MSSSDENDNQLTKILNTKIECKTAYFTSKQTCVVVVVVCECCNILKQTLPKLQN
ncbi:unnamed protein product [Schistosoma margrebowiei]|uniref:Uncharacterized protein n=1 Tax=Schistosoma margrebowiei TaxID=48269 RepID=A0A183N2U8_9TREM|nr:unnamed protein product [Schistosoma margrebowiei]